MFKSPHLTLLFVCTIALVVLIFMRFLCTAPLLFTFLNNFDGRGADTVTIGFSLSNSWNGGAEKCVRLRLCVGFWVGNCWKRRAEKCVKLRLCLLVSTLGCHGFGPLINLARFLEMRAAPSQVGWMPSLRIRPGLPQKVCQWSTKPTSFAGHHLDNQRRNDDMRLYMSSLVRFGRGPEKTTVSDIVFAYVHTDSTLILVTSDWRNRESLPPTWITILLYLRLSLASSFK